MIKKVFGRSVTMGIVAYICTFLIGKIPSGFAQTASLEEYYPNYKIQTKWDKMIEILENIEASTTVGTEVSPGTFNELNGIFAVLFPYFPKSPNNNVVYKQCDLTTKDMGTEVTDYKYELFKERCFSPVGQIVQQINSKFTVKPQIVAKPQQGSAPLNVTLDARGSVDPSNDTIPSDNFFWYYKNVQGIDTIIGRGPVVNYTFPDAGNHIVHLTVRSANRQTQGVFDGQSSISINVAPEAAQINLFVNGKKALVDRLVKIGMEEGQSTVLLDASPTRPMGARTIVSHLWEITSDQRYTFKQEGEGSPGELRHTFPAQGIYKIKIEVTDNENNKIQKTFQISVSDPVAIIRAKPEQGTTSTQFVFDGSPSYSVSSKIRKYQRQVFDPQGNQIGFVDAKELKQQFVVPGTYTVKLVVVDNGGVMSTDTMELQVGSTPPIPSFTITPTTELKYPSKFILDASSTIDDDLRNGGDALMYDWTFSSPEQIKIETTEDENKRIIITVNETGNYKVYLTVTDKYGEARKIEKELKVNSVLRPEMLINPLVGSWGEEVTFFAKINAPVAFYERDFGDGKKQQTQEPKVTHAYQRSGIYKVTLRVINDLQQENTLTKQVFAGQKELPVVAWIVKSSVGNVELTPTGSCGEGTGATPAYIVDRYQQLLLDSSSSRTILGDNASLRISFHPQNDEIYNSSILNYKFAELGCQRVDITVDDTNSGKSNNTRVRFNVQNALPLINNLTLQFPQAKQQSQFGVGATPVSLGDTDLAIDTTLSSIVVTATAQGTRDPDGSISYYRWWYYPNGDNTRKEGFKITPAAINTVTFVIPKPGSPTEYAFVVEAVDNDGGKISSEDLLGKGPIVFFPPGEVQLDQPLVSFKADTVNARAGDNVNFTITASIPSERPDFEATRMIKYDFDGDGIYDQTTKKTAISYAYTKPGTYTPKAAVYYRDRVGVALAEKITVVKAVTPRVLYAVHDRTVLVRDVTMGDVEESTLCMRDDLCGSGTSGSDTTSLFTGKSFVYTYPEYGEYLTRLAVIDAYGNELEKKDKLTITAQSGFSFLSIPEAIRSATGGYEITISNSMQNVWDAFLADSKNCSLDMDITVDSDQDGDPTMDTDVRCNELFTYTFTPLQKYQEGKLYRVLEGKVVEEPVRFLFLDIEDQVVPEGYELIAKSIDELISHIPDNSEDTYVGYYKDILKNLRASLGDAAERSSLVIQLRQLVGNYPHIVPKEDKETVAMVLVALADSTVQSAFGGTIYDTEKNNILVWFEEPVKSEVMGLFEAFEKAQGNQDEMKKHLDAIANRAAEERSMGNIDETDFNYIRTSLCSIVTYYELPSKTCGETEDTVTDNDTIKKPTATNSGEKKPLLRIILRILMWVVIVLVLVFIGLILFFSLKAKKHQEEFTDPAPENTPSA